MVQGGRDPQVGSQLFGANLLRFRECSIQRDNMNSPQNFLNRSHGGTSQAYCCQLVPRLGAQGGQYQNVCATWRTNAVQHCCVETAACEIVFHIIKPDNRIL